MREDGTAVVGVGKISDIFAGEGITRSHPDRLERRRMDTIEELWARATDGLIFANLVDFDMLYGHRRDVAGYARALAEFDRLAGRFSPRRSRRTISSSSPPITATIPTFRGTDHTREEVPLFVLHSGESRDLGTRETFADVAATLGGFLSIARAMAWSGVLASSMPIPA